MEWTLVADLAEARAQGEKAEDWWPTLKGIGGMVENAVEVQTLIAAKTNFKSVRSLAENMTPALLSDTRCLP